MRHGTLIGLNLLAALAASGPSSAAKPASYLEFEFSPETPYYVENGKVDFGTYNGFRRYHAECHICHGPAGMGSSYAPALMKSMQVLNFDQFVETVIRGRKGLDNRVMPSFASNMNVLPYLSDIYAYLKARSDGAVGTTRPDKFPKVASGSDAQAETK